MLNCVLIWDPCISLTVSTKKQEKCLVMSRKYNSLIAAAVHCCKSYFLSLR